MKNFFINTAVAAALAALAACSSTENTQNETTGIQNSQWSLQGSDEAFIAFAEDGVSGNSGCNSFSGTYQSADNMALTFSPLASTRMACLDDAANETERSMLDGLGNTASYAVNGDTMMLKNAAGETLLTFTRRASN